MCIGTLKNISPVHSLVAQKRIFVAWCMKENLRRGCVSAYLGYVRTKRATIRACVHVRARERERERKVQSLHRSCCRLDAHFASLSKCNFWSVFSLRKFFQKYLFW